ncbi:MULTISPECIES: indole-3-glycerol phosphate synthase TrpC [Thermodesulfovibrio]|uniref:Indole-3-glycerol phosphate synthase n=2 Tax=Thermodesulfovibrio yellowstonii TaxID=28262 RepID=B5YGU5_THEYD|nr:MULTISPECIES: indole-3-glycerol phosphate synthase TrpC [Thermodesulfovibrio]ACI20642.1 indole-3-glycerol phosphate synthase [Thermodesulfovibrio yellowstonii DSM 11347]GLI52550.1 indole-3-glycerol phosphate synthase [Thermodesulfovibrio islandicus]
MNILQRIVERKKLRITEQKKVLSFEDIKKKALAFGNKSDYLFYKKIKRLPHEPIKLIAEIKKASPLKGILKEYDIEEMANIYVSSGADAISVITEEDFFLGNPQFLVTIKKNHPHIPVLRKDFIFDEYQVYESKLLHSDAILLIASILTKEQCKTLYELTKSLGMDVLFEIHDEEDLDKSLFAGADIIGINNRNLKTLQIDINTTFKLKKLIPEGKVIVSESGISGKSHVQELIKQGVDAILVGTSIVLSDNPAEKIKELKFS